MIHCPRCGAKTSARDSRSHALNSTKRRRCCTKCDWVGNSIEVLLGEDFENKHTEHLMPGIRDAAEGSALSAQIAARLRSLADEVARLEPQIPDGPVPAEELEDHDPFNWGDQ